MKLFQRVPDLTKVKVTFTPEFSGKISPVLRKANNECMYWDDFKNVEMPEGIPPEQAWAVLKMYRTLQARPLSLADTKGEAFTYWLPHCVHRDIHLIDKQAACPIAANDPSVGSEERRRYMVRSLVDEAISSSQLEGAATSRPVAKEMLRAGRKPRDRSEQMIHNTYETMQQLKKHLEEPLSLELILAVHRQLTRDAVEDPSRSGRFRTKSDGEIQVFGNDEQAHDAPDAARIPELMQELCEFANSGGKDEFVNPVIKGILMHFWIAYAQPFAGDNGRTARALFYWYMFKHHYRVFEYLSVSTAILTARAQYYREFLRAEMDGNDATYFIAYNLKAILTSMDILNEDIEKKKNEKKQSYRLAAKYSALNPRQRMLLASAFEKPQEVYVIETHANIHAITYQTARTDLLSLERLGLLDLRKEGKKFVFTPVPNLAKKLES